MTGLHFSESVAQLAEHQVVALVAVGSNPITLPTQNIHQFYHFWPLRLEARTRGFRPRNRGSIPLGVTIRHKKTNSTLQASISFGGSFF